MIIEVKMHNTDSFKFTVANLLATGITDVASFISAYDMTDTSTTTFAEIVSTKTTTVLNKAQISSIAIYA